MTKRKDWLNGNSGKKRVCRLYWPENNNLGMYILFENESKKVLDAKTYRRDGTETATSLLFKETNINLDDALKCWESMLLIPDPIPTQLVDGWQPDWGYQYPLTPISGITISLSNPNEYGMPYLAPGVYPLTSGTSSFSSSTTTYTSNYRVEYEEYEEEDDQEKLDK